MSIGNWGLFNSRSILVEHGGDIDIESLEGHGTTVTVRLPLSSTASSTIQPDDPGFLSASGRAGRH